MLWQLDTNLKQFLPHLSAAIESLAVSPKGTLYALRLSDNSVIVLSTAELEPITETYVQSDEADMGFTYDELSILGRLRKSFKLGMVGMFERLVVDWSDRAPRDVYKKVRDFMYYYAINRHKMTTITPGLYLESYTPDDNRYDLRPFLYPKFTFEHRKIENMLKKVWSLDSSLAELQTNGCNRWKKARRAWRMVCEDCSLGDLAVHPILSQSRSARIVFRGRSSTKKSTGCVARADSLQVRCKAQ